MRRIVSFSSGAGSAMAARRVADRYGTDDLFLLFADVNGEHPDNYRFLWDAARWVGGQLVILTNDGKTIWDVFKAQRFLGNTRVDLCSRVLKREPIQKWLDRWCDPADTVMYLGFDWTEEHRHIRAARAWLPWQVESPMLWDPVMDKAEGMAQMAAAGIEPPLLTRLGFPHANCGGGCVKAGAKHFKKLLAELPDTFAEWEANEQAMQVHLGQPVTILRDRRGGTTKPLSLTQLRERIEADQTTQLFDDEDWGGCNCFTPIEDDKPEEGAA